MYTKGAYGLRSAANTSSSRNSAVMASTWMGSLGSRTPRLSAARMRLGFSARSTCSAGTRVQTSLSRKKAATRTRRGCEGAANVHA